MNDLLELKTKINELKNLEKDLWQYIHEDTDKFSQLLSQHETLKKLVVALNIEINAIDKEHTLFQHLNTDAGKKITLLLGYLLVDVGLQSNELKDIESIARNKSKFSDEDIARINVVLNGNYKGPNESTNSKNINQIEAAILSLISSGAPSINQDPIDQKLQQLIELSKDPKKVSNLFTRIQEVINSKEVYEKLLHDGKIDLLIDNLDLNPEVFDMISCATLFYDPGRFDSNRDFDPGLKYITSRVMKRFESEFHKFLDRRVEHVMVSFLNNINIEEVVHPILRKYFKIDITAAEDESQKYIIVKHFEEGHLVFTLFSRKTEDYHKFDKVWPESPYFAAGREPQHAGLSMIFGYEHKLNENQYETIAGAKLHNSEKFFFGTSERYGNADGQSNLLAISIMCIYGDDNYKS